MSAVTANQLIARREGCKRSYKAAAVHIYQGTLVFLTAAGYATDVTATGVNGFLGIAVEEVDNSAGSAGDMDVEVWTEGDFQLLGTATVVIADVGSQVYAADNFLTTLALGAATVPIGKVVEYVDTTHYVVAIKPVGVGTLPTALTTISIADAAGTPDYALQALTTTSPYGLATAAEAITLLYVIKDLQTRVLDLETRGR